jgi:hypothetical protein
MNTSGKQKYYQDSLLSKDFFLTKNYGYQHLSTNKEDETGKISIVFINKAIVRLSFILSHLMQKMKNT